MLLIQHLKPMFSNTTTFHLQGRTTPLYIPNYSLVLLFIISSKVLGSFRLPIRVIMSGEELVLQLCIDGYQIVQKIYLIFYLWLLKWKIYLLTIICQTFYFYTWREHWLSHYKTASLKTNSRSRHYLLFCWEEVILQLFLIFICF